MSFIKIGSLQMWNNTIIQLINRILRANSGALYRLQKYATCTFCLSSPLFTIRGLICANGEFAPYAGDETDVSVNIPASILPSIIAQDKILLYRQIKISGNHELAKTLLETLSDLHLDGVYQPQSQFGRIIMHQFSTVSKQIRDYLLLVNKNATISIRDYLIYESKTLANQYELDKFTLQVEQLHMDLERINKKLQLSKL